MSAYQVQQCLTKANSKYVDSAKRDVLAALQQFKDLNPGNEQYRFPDGKTRQAFRLKGTIPVYYKGACYNIPVTVYLWETHPYYAPICIVNPTSTMVIRENEHVNKEGRVFLPYLNEWRFPGYDLSGLLQVMAMVFQEKCPVFAKSATNSTTTATPTASTQSAMPTPYPTGGGATPYPNTTPYPTAGQAGYNPYINVPTSTPYPVGGGVTPYPNPTPPPRPPPHTQSTNTGTVQADAIKASMYSAIEDKIRASLRDKMGTNSAEMASIQSTGKELREGREKLNKMAEEVEAQKMGLITVVELYTAKKNELLKALSDAGGMDAPPIDEAIDASTPLHRQIVTNYALDLTCDDVIYALGQSLKKGKLTTSEYLRRVRDVSREQFICRATMQKCRRVAGLPI